jgi:hypothetical protein
MSYLKNTEEAIDTINLKNGLIAIILSLTLGVLWGIGGTIKEIKSELQEANQHLKETRCFSPSPRVELLEVEEDFPRVRLLEERREPAVRLLEDPNDIIQTR